MRAVDTNVLIRIIARDDALQVAAADEYIAGGAWVSTLVLTEAIWVLASRYRRSPADLIRILEVLLKHESLVLQDAEQVAAAVELFRSRPSLGFSGCLILQVARKGGYVPLGTFDRAFARCEGTQKL